MGKQWIQWETLFSLAPTSLQMVTAAMKLKETCSLEERTNLDSVLKSRNITFSTKGHLVKAMVFPVVMHWCESWTVKKAEHQRIDAFELWCWRRLLRVLWAARRSNQSILKEISPEYSLEGLMLKLKLQYFGHLMWRTDSLEKILMLGTIEGRRRRGQQRMGGWLVSLTRWTWVWASSWSWRWTGKPGMLQSIGSHSVRHDWATELTECFQGPSIFLQWWDFLLYIAENIQLCKYLIVLVAQLCLILCHPMGYSLPGSSVYEIL